MTNEAPPETDGAGVDLPRLVLDSLDLRLLKNAHRKQWKRYQQAAIFLDSKGSHKVALRMRLKAVKAQRKTIEIGKKFDCSTLSISFENA